jgi:integrase
MEDTRTGEIDRRLALAFRTKLRDLPARNGKSVYAGLSPSAAIALAKDITAQIDRGESVIRLGARTLRAAEAAAVAEPISFKSCNKVLTFLTAFGSWAEQNERRDWFGPGGNPFTRLLYRKQTVRAHRDSDKARRAMPDEVLRLLFSSPVWAGRDPHADILEGSHRPRDAKFWLPLIALYSGMRLSEIAQLRLADIRTEQGVAFFAVLNTAETSTKTPSSERFVPIHRELIRLGLLDRVAELTRRGERRLFPEIVARATQGDDYGATFSRWFSRYRYGLAERMDAAGKRFQPLGRKGCDFHALRHTFITRARETRAMTDAQLDRITGHTGQAMRDNYTGDLSLVGLADAVNAVRFDLDLSHLLPRE